MRKLSNIQVLRGLAALAVVILHARNDIEGLGIPSRLPQLVIGAFGVDVFFVISGFVMVHASVPLFGHARSALPFFAKRLARIVPLYWAVTLAFIVLAPVAAQGDLSHRAFRKFVGLSLAFMPYLAPVNDDSFPVYPLGWTLNYEMAFYFCFAVTLASAMPRRLAIASLTIGFAALATASILMPLPAWLGYLGATQILEFVAGLLIAEVTLSGVRLPRWAAGALVLGGVAAAVSLVGSTDSWWNPWRGIAWGLPAAAIVAGFALCPPTTAPGAVRRWFERLGDASYALYLVHYALFIAIEGLLGRVLTLSHLPAVPLMLLLIGAAVPVAFVVHRYFEVPVTRWLQHRVAPRQAPSLAVSRG